MRIYLKALGFCVLATAAGAQTYDCTMEKWGTHGFVPDRLFLGLEADAGAGSAYDYFINQIHETPIPVTLKKRNDTSWQFSWTLRGVEVSNEGSGVLTHHVTLNTAKNTFRLRGRLHGYDNNIHGSGRCKIVK